MRGSRASSRVSSAALLLAVFCGIVSCNENPAPHDRSLPDVVVIVIDTLRADHLSFHGYPRETAPFLASLARNGVVFENALSCSSKTAPATASIFTALHPSQHGVQHGMMATQRMQKVDPTIELNRIPDALVTLPERLSDAGYTTFGFTDNLNISEAEGFHQGFDVFSNSSYEGAESVNRRLFEHADDIRESQPAFVYLHYMDPHLPYHERAPWFAEFRDSPVELGARPIEARNDVDAYDSEIRYVDAAIRRALERCGWIDAEGNATDREAIVILTSDHGEGFGEHGDTGHGKNLYGETVRVPFLFYAPGRFEAGRRSEGVQTLDLYPTLLALLGIPRDPSHAGVSLADSLEAPAEPTDRALVMQLVYKEQGRVRWFMGAARRGDWKFVRYRSPTAAHPAMLRLYDLSTDPHELQDLWALYPDHARRLEAELDAVLRQPSPVPAAATRLTLDPATLDHLRKLGYVDE